METPQSASGSTGEDTGAATPAAHGRRAPWLVLGLTVLAMFAFAANSLLTRLALQATAIDAATFSAVRIATGAMTLAAIVLVGRQRVPISALGWLSAALLFLYVLAFSYAYRGMEVGAGALVLFASAQLLMVGAGFARGERTRLPGAALALVGLVLFLAPSLAPSPAAAPPVSAALMVLAGLAWGGFSLLGRAGDSPVAGTAASFIWAVPMALAWLLVAGHPLQPDPRGVAYAALSGSVTSALGYVAWYWVRTRMSAIGAGTVQLSVPVLSAVLGVLLLDERLSAGRIAAGALVLAGVAWSTLPPLSIGQRDRRR